jgi:hypothetical protein
VRAEFPRLLGVGPGTTSTQERASQPQARDLSLEGGWRCDACQRPTLTGAGSLEKVAGLATLGPRNTLLQHQLHSVCTRRLLLMLHFQIPFVSEPSKGR